MFNLNFILKKRKDGSLILVMPIWFRIMFLFIAVLPAAWIFAAVPGGSGYWIPILIMLACIAAALYEEKWIFNRSENKIEYRSGIMLINSKKSFDIKDVEIFKLSENFHKEKEGKLSRLRKKMTKFSIILNSGQILDIDTASGKTESAELKKKAEQITAYCDVELKADGKNYKPLI